MTVRIRGIYATALTRQLEDVVQPSPAIRERVEGGLPEAPAAATLTTTGDRQGVAVSGNPDRVATIRERLTGLAVDAMDWTADLPVGAVYAGEVTETLGSGAIVDVGDGEGFLHYGATTRRIDEGDRLRVQVTEPRAPWLDGRPVLDTDVAVRGHLVTLRRGGGSDAAGAAGPHLGDLVSAEAPEGWGVRWEREDDDSVSLDALDDALAAASERAAAIDEALADGPPPAEAAPHRYWADVATAFVWFGRETRFALDEHRRAVTDTMPGHHRIKAGTEAASAAVDFVEAICGGDAGVADAAGDDGGAPVDDSPDLGDPEGPFPFATLTRQFGPREGDALALHHGKPDGRCLTLGDGEVTSVEADGTVELEREMTPGGTYDALGVERRAGDVATTTLREGRWWYPTVYRGADGDLRGTYVNVCTPVEVFPDAARYVDLHVDVVKHADGTVERVDDDELDAAVAAGHVSEALAKKARAVASAVERAL